MNDFNSWFSLHLPDEKARKMTRAEYYAARSYLRRVQQILHLRYAAAYVHPDQPNTIIIPATDDVLPKGFK